MSGTPSAAPGLPVGLLLPAVALPVFLAIANQTMISVALPPIGADLGELARLPWLVVGYMLALTIAGPAYGALGDMLGRKSMLMVALWVYVAGTALCAFAPGFGVLALGRLVQGLGGGGLMVLSQALIGQAVAARERGRMQGYVATIGVLASTAGPLAGGLLVELAGWRSMFLATIPLAFVGMGMLMKLRLPQRVRQTRGFDLAGFVYLNLLVIGVTVAMELLKGLGQPQLVWAAAAVAVAGLAGLLVTERRAANPLFPPALLRMPPIWRAKLMAGFHGAALVAFASFVPLYLRIVHGQEVLEAALMLLALTAGLGTGGFITGHLITLTGRTAFFPSVGLFVAVVMIAGIALWGAGLPMYALAIMLILCGLGLGTVMSVVHTTVQQSAPEEMRGSAAGGVTFARSIGSVVGTTAVSLVLFSVALTPGETAEATSALLATPQLVDAEAAGLWVAGFRAAFLTVAVFSFAAWLMALSTPARRV